MTRKDCLAVAALAAAVLALTAPVWGRPGRAFFNHGDLYAYHWPLRHLTAAALAEGRLPFWNPYMTLGVPHAANPQIALFYPAGVLGYFLPSVTALVWDQILHLLWAGLGAFILARSARLPRAGALSLAAAYALSPFLVYRITAGIPTLVAALSWAPWAWLAWLEGSVILLAAVFALQFFSGHPQFLVVNAVGMGAWAALRPERLALWKKLALGASGAMLLAAAQWLPTLELLRGSNRSDWPARFTAAYSMRPADLFLWLSPGAFGTPLNGVWEQPVSVFYESGGVWLGVIALSLAFIGAVRGRARAGAALLIALGTLLALGANGPLAALLRAPGLSYLRTPSRWSFLALWGLWLLAGSGLRALATSPRRVAALAVLPLLVFAELAGWDARFLRPVKANLYTAANPAVAIRLGGRDARVLTDPALANPNKSVVYRVRNANGYDAFYPATAAVWAAEADGKPAADPSWVFASRWKSEAATRAGVRARLSPTGIEERDDAWPLAVFLDEKGGRVRPDPVLSIERPERWRVAGPAPKGATQVGLAETRWPGWRATVDGLPAALAPWGAAFMKLPLTAPVLDLRLDFAPTLWYWWVALSASAWAAWLAFALRGEAS